MFENKKSGGRKHYEMGFWSNDLCEFAIKLQK